MDLTIAEVPKVEIPKTEEPKPGNKKEPKLPRPNIPPPELSNYLQPVNNNVAPNQPSPSTIVAPSIVEMCSCESLVVEETLDD